MPPTDDPAIAMPITSDLRCWKNWESTETEGMYSKPIETPSAIPCARKIDA